MGYKQWVNLFFFNLSTFKNIIFNFPLPPLENLGSMKMSKLLVTLSCKDNLILIIKKLLKELKSIPIIIKTLISIPT